MSMQATSFAGLVLFLKSRSYRVVKAFDTRTRVTRTRWSVSIPARADKALEALVALPPGRLRATLYGLMLLETYVVVTIVLTVVTDLASAGPFVSDSPPDQSGLVFLAVILFPALLYGVRWLQKEAADRRAYDVCAEEDARRWRAPTRENAYHALYLRADAPLYIAEAAYIAAMKRAHPDIQGGSNEQATRLTQAIEIIRAAEGVHHR